MCPPVLAREARAHVTHSAQSGREGYRGDTCSASKPVRARRTRQRSASRLLTFCFIRLPLSSNATPDVSGPDDKDENIPPKYGMLGRRAGVVSQHSGRLIFKTRIH